MLRLTLVASMVILLVASFAAAPAGAAEFDSRTGALAGADPAHVGRSTLGGDPSTCASQDTYPGTSNAVSPFRYELTGHASLVNEPICVTVTLTTACAGGTAINSTSYIPGFTPGNLSAGFVAKLGDSPPGDTTYSFVVPPGSNFVTIVDEANSLAGCANYTVTWDADRPWADSRPTVAGPAGVGETLVAVSASWAPADATLSHVWLRCDANGDACSTIAGANGAAYVATDADYGHTLAVRETATSNGLSSSSDSAVTLPVSLPFAHMTSSLTGADSMQSGRLNRNGIRSRCGSPKATPPIQFPANEYFYDAYPVVNLGNEERCVTATTSVPGGTTCTGQAFSLAYSPTYSPSSLQDGYVADAGSSNGTSNASQGYAYTHAPGQNVVHVVVTANTGLVCNAYELTLGADAPWVTALPQLSGTVREGAALTTTNGTWSGSPGFAYAWLRCDSGGNACSPIDGATSSTYSPSTADVGRRIRARVTATQAGRSASADSAASEVVTAATRVPDGGGGPGGATPVDRLAPKATLKFKSADARRALGRSRLPVALTCDENCTVTVELRITSKLAKKYRLGKRVVIGKARGSLTAGRARTLTVKLTSLAKKRVRGARSLKVTLAAVARDGAGNRGSASARATLRRNR